MTSIGSRGSWLRRTIPVGYAEATLEIVGTAPLLMNSPDADRDGELYRAYFMLGQKKRKSLDDEARLRELEWQLRLYLDAELGPFLPARMVKAVLVAAATKWRRGTDVERSLVVLPYRIGLVYDGPRDQAGLWAAGYRYTTMVKNAGFNAGRVMRCRPMFAEWAISVPLAWDPEELDADFLALVVERSQRYGIGDYRPEFGSFRARLTRESAHKDGSNGSAMKGRDRHAEAGHEAAKARVIG